ncbi:hypothetical protein FIC27_23030 [Escherichia coli]|nr:hypothetical protein FIC27_23030 [Escherichia coli]
MIKHLVAPLVFTSLILTGCQSPQGKFTPEQVAAMQSYGFTESAGDWSLGVTNGAIVIHTQRLKSDPGGNLLS